MLILRLPHSFGVCGCWGRSNTIDFAILQYHRSIFDGQESSQNHRFRCPQDSKNNKMDGIGTLEFLRGEKFVGSFAIPVRMRVQCIEKIRASGLLTPVPSSHIVNRYRSGAKLGFTRCKTRSLAKITRRSIRGGMTTGARWGAA